MDKNDALRDILARFPGALRRGSEAPRQAPAAAPDIVPAAPPPPAAAADDALANVEINDDFRQALEVIESGASPVFVTGKAGTGKSTFIHYLRATVRRNVAVVAPTGVAALNARGQTVHSFFRLPARLVDPSDIKPAINAAMYKKIDLLIIDEVSMVRADVLDGIDAFLRLNGRDRERPFGGLQVVMVGDLAQLPPVVSTPEEIAYFRERYRTELFFDAKCLAQAPLRAIQFTKVYRQADARFLKILNAIREGDEDLLESSLETLNRGRVGPRPRDAGVVTLTTTNADADRVNDRELEALPGAEKVYQGIVDGKFGAAEARLPSPAALRLKLGAQVMFTKNDPLRRWVNGTVGAVRALSPDRISVEIDLNGKGATDVDVERASWESVRYRYDPMDRRLRTEIAGAFVQFPLMPSWAVTVHKAQGKTLDRAHIQLGQGAFAPGQLYVALSRCRSLEGLSLDREIRYADVIVDERVKEFHASLRRSAWPA